MDIKMLQKMQKELQERIRKNEEEMKTKVVDASSGGGLVTASVNGNQELVSIKIGREAVDEDDLEMLEDLVVAAVNSALEKSRRMKEDGLSEIAGGLKIPGMF